MKSTISIIAYYRVSTRKQGDSGLGLEAQKRAVAAYSAQVGGTIVAEYIEVESGKDSERPKLKEAIAHTRLVRNGLLVVAKLDRLSRNVKFIATLMDAMEQTTHNGGTGFNFVCCDNPSATRLTLHVLAAMAEYEGLAASRRTKDALAAAKARGVALGSARPGHWEGREDRRGWKQGAKKSAEARSKRCRDAYSFLVPKLREMQAQGLSFEEMAKWLNDNGHVTIRQNAFGASTVWRILKRADEEEAQTKPKETKRRKVSA